MLFFGRLEPPSYVTEMVDTNFFISTHREAAHELDLINYIGSKLLENSRILHMIKDLKINLLRKVVGNGYKPYQKPPLLELFKCLQPRFELPSDEKQQYINLDKGHQGEHNFSVLLENITSGCLILHGLLLEYNKTLFQIDVLLIF